MVPFKVQDEILVALHENDYGIAKTIEFFLERSGDLSHDWKTAGIRTKKSNASPNQTLEESEANEVPLVTNQQQQHSNLHRTNNKPNTKQKDSQNNSRSRDKIEIWSPASLLLVAYKRLNLIKIKTINSTMVRPLTMPSLI